MNSRENEGPDGYGNNADRKADILWQNSSTARYLDHERHHPCIDPQFRNRGDILEHQELLTASPAVFRRLRAGAQAREGFRTNLAEAVKEPIDGFIKIETEEDPKQIALDAVQVAAEALNLRKIMESPRCNASIGS
jgi:hypothetical protein